MPLSDEALKNTIGVPITLNTFLKDHEKDWLMRHQYYTAVALGTSVSTVLSVCEIELEVEIVLQWSLTVLATVSIGWHQDSNADVCACSFEA